MTTYPRLQDGDLIDTGLTNEVIRFGIEAGKVVNFAKDHQFCVVDHITAGEMERRFLTLPNGVLFGKIMPMMNFLLIEHA
jgi:hypothetical protein